MPQSPLRQGRGPFGVSVIGHNLWCCLAAVVSVGVYAIFAATFFPSPPGRLGFDYSYFLPIVLAGKYWIAQNGIFAVPNFSPAFCGGLPFLANPQSIFYSVPQALSEIVDLEKSFFATTVLFASLGGLGTFALLRVRFAASVPAACLGAVIFLFNGFLLYRMAIGHVTYHVVGLLPLICYVLLTPVAGFPDRCRRFCLASALGGIMIAYFVYAGAVNIIVPLAISALAVALLHALVRRPTGFFISLGISAGLLAALAGAAKLVPAIAFVAAFPRVEDLGIFPNFASALGWLMRALFLPWTIPEFKFRHEMELGLGPVALALLIGGACAAIARGALRRRYDLRGCATAIGLAAVLVVPLWLNSGTPQFAVWLKSLPYIGENALLVRWFLIYLLPVTVGAALFLDYLFAGPQARAGVAVIGMLATIVPAVFADTTHYRQLSYDPAVILAADRALAASGVPPPIAGFSGGRWEQRNDGLASGKSAFPCYEPIFGFRLESFPSGILRGPLSLPGHHLRNPACYIYGRENGCAPGDSFTAATATAEAAFAAYRPFPYRRPWWQKAADIASLSGLTLIVAGIGIGVYRLRRRQL